jgi:predicted GTPase
MSESQEVATPPVRPLTEVTKAVITLLEQAMVPQKGATHEELRQIRDALREPVRIAVAGRVNAGKSTLVNALVGQIVAPTDVSECTKMVTWYRYGTPQRLEIVMRDGTRRRERLGAGGRLPSELGVDHADVRWLEAWLANDTLRSMTLIDTPGLGSLNADYSAAAEDFLATDQASAEATAVADAIVFILNTQIRADEAAAVRSFRESSGGPGGAAGNAIGVLSKADKLASGPGWWDAAQRLAKRLAEQLQDDLVTVMPVVGLIAETTESAQLTERDSANLAELAGMEPADLALLQLSATRFTSGDAPVSAEDRTRLLSLLDLQGIGVAVELLRDGLSGATALRHAMSDRAGIEELRSLITDTFRGKGEALKIRSALQNIERLCAAPPGDADLPALLTLADDAERLRLAPVMHQLAVTEAFMLWSSGTVSLPDELSADLIRMATGATPAERLGATSDAVREIRQTALDGSARWHGLLVAAYPGQARIARTMWRSYALAYEQAGGR